MNQKQAVKHGYSWNRCSPTIQIKTRRHDDRISDNEIYTEADKDGGAVPSDQWNSLPLDEVREFYRVRLRDAEAFDYPVLRLAEFFDQRHDDVVELQWTIQRVDVLMVHRAISCFLKDWTELPPCSKQRDLFTPLSFLSVEVAPQVWETAMIDGRRYWKHPDGRRLCVDVWESRNEEFEVSFLTRLEDQEFVRALWPKMQEWMNANHYLRQQRFSVDLHFISLPDHVVWEHIILPDKIRNIIRSNTIEFLERREIHQRFGLPLRRGILLHGPPGSGKTMIGRALAQECECTFIAVSASDMAFPIDVKNIFRLARRLAPTILFFEDIDLVGADRHASDCREILGELLTCLDGIESPDGVIVIATTNNLIAIEPALKERPNRFDVVVEVPPLDHADSVRYILNWLSSRNMLTEFTVKVPDGIGKLTGAQLQEVCTNAALHALYCHRTSVGTNNRLNVTEEDLLMSLKSIGKAHKPRVGFGGYNHDEY